MNFQKSAFWGGSIDCQAHKNRYTNDPPGAFPCGSFFVAAEFYSLSFVALVVILRILS